MTRQVPQIGLTGPIGSGKSLVAEFFRSWGSEIIDADIHARKLLQPESPAYAYLLSALGPQVTRPDGSLDRFALRHLIFSDNDLRKALEAKLHPEIRLLMKSEAESLMKRGCTSITFVIPLLFEGRDSYDHLTDTVLVSTKRELCIERAGRRDSCSKAIIAKILDCQMPLAEKERLADHVIYNNGTIEELSCSARLVYQKILSRFNN